MDLKQFESYGRVVIHCQTMVYNSGEYRVNNLPVIGDMQFTEDFVRQNFNCVIKDASELALVFITPFNNSEPDAIASGVKAEKMFREFVEIDILFKKRDLLDQQNEIGNKIEDLDFLLSKVRE